MANGEQTIPVQYQVKSPSWITEHSLYIPLDNVFSFVNTYRLPVASSVMYSIKLKQFKISFHHIKYKVNDRIKLKRQYFILFFYEVVIILKYVSSLAINRFFFFFLIYFIYTFQLVLFKFPHTSNTHNTVVLLPTLTRVNLWPSSPPSHMITHCGPPHTCHFVALTPLLTHDTLWPSQPP